MRTKGNEKPESWEKIYREGKPGWDIAKPAPPFTKLLESAPEWLKIGKLINFGSGNGHDANFFAEQGFQVTAVDFAPSAIESCREYAKSNVNLEVLEADLLSLPKNFETSFDYVLEHTCYCAIPRENRRAYMEAAFHVLKPGAYLFGLFYRFDPPDLDGPPYSLSMEEFEASFEGLFELISCETPKQSHGRRTNRERLVALKKLS